MQVDGVFSGGGIRGLAFVGAHEVLEEKGFKFKRLAGTSAGSIIAAFLAAGFTNEELKDAMTDLSQEDILDKRQFQIPFPILKWLPIYWRMGIYKGQALENWITDQLLKKDVRTFSDLPAGSLKIVASDLSNGRILILPDDLHRYNQPPEAFPVAKAVRMSCTVPYFFEPVRLNSGKGKAVIVDGGVLSNFPMWIFNDGRSKPIRPVIGIRLSPHYNEIPPKEIRNALELFEALFATMKDAHDNRYISKKHVKDIIFIPTDHTSSLDFALDDDQIEALLNRGREETIKFLKSWSY